MTDLFFSVCFVESELVLITNCKNAVDIELASVGENKWMLFQYFKTNVLQCLLHY